MADDTSKKKYTGSLQTTTQGRGKLTGSVSVSSGSSSSSGGGSSGSSNANFSSASGKELMVTPSGQVVGSSGNNFSSASGKELMVTPSGQIANYTDARTGQASYAAMPSLGARGGGFSSQNRGYSPAVQGFETRVAALETQRENAAVRSERAADIFRAVDVRNIPYVGTRAERLPYGDYYLGLRGDNYTASFGRNLLALPSRVAVGLPEQAFLGGQSMAATFEGFSLAETRARTREEVARARAATPGAALESINPFKPEGAVNLLAAVTGVVGGGRTASFSRANKEFVGVVTELPRPLGEAAGTVKGTLTIGDRSFSVFRTFESSRDPVGQFDFVGRGKTFVTKESVVRSSADSFRGVGTRSIFDESTSIGTLNTRTSALSRGAVLPRSSSDVASFDSSGSFFGGVKPRVGRPVSYAGATSDVSSSGAQSVRVSFVPDRFTPRVFGRRGQTAGLRDAWSESTGVGGSGALPDGGYAGGLRLPGSRAGSSGRVGYNALGVQQGVLAGAEAASLLRPYAPITPGLAGATVGSYTRPRSRVSALTPSDARSSSFGGPASFPSSREVSYSIGAPLAPSVPVSGVGTIAEPSPGVLPSPDVLSPTRSSPVSRVVSSSVSNYYSYGAPELPMFDLPQMPSFGGGGGGQFDWRMSNAIRFKNQYAPSIAGSFFDVKTSRRQANVNTLTGLGVRPVKFA